MKIWIFLDIRSRVGSPFKAVKFHGSPHVGHLRYNKQKYTEEVTAFINDGTIKRKMEWKTVQAVFSKFPICCNNKIMLSKRVQGFVSLRYKYDNNLVEGNSICFDSI